MVQAQQNSIILQKTTIDESLLKKRSEGGDSAALERAVGILEAQLVDSLAASQLFSVDRRTGINTDGPSNIVLGENSFLLNLLVSDFADESARGDQGQTQIARSDQIKRQRARINALSQQLPKMRNPQRRAAVEAEIQQLQSSVASLTVLDKKSTFSRQVSMAVQYRVTDSGNLERSTGVASFRTNRFTHILTEDVKKAEESEDLVRGTASVIARQITLGVADKIAPAKVLEKKDGQVTLGWGSGCGLTPGQTLMVYARRLMSDPQTQKTLGEHEVPVGKVRIRQISSQFSTADIVEDTGISPGAVARATR